MRCPVQAMEKEECLRLLHTVIGACIDTDDFCDEGTIDKADGEGRMNCHAVERQIYENGGFGK